MKKSAQKIRATTQRFTEIEEIKENVVLLTSGNACMVIEVMATNFSLLSAGEQQAKMGSYATLLNSLSFPLQIIVQNKKLDISSYLKLLDQAGVSSQNKLLSDQIALYRNFVADLVKLNSVLDKKFYIVIPYSFLEGNVVGKKEDFFTSAKQNLSSKAESLHSQLTNVNLSAKILSKEELMRLFYEFYNGDLSAETNIEESKTPFVKGKEIQ